jgi:hypothetical protein
MCCVRGLMRGLVARLFFFLLGWQLLNEWIHEGSTYLFTVFFSWGDDAGDVAGGVPAPLGWRVYWDL